MDSLRQSEQPTARSLITSRSASVPASARSQNRQLAGIPTTHEFPYCPCDGWMAAAPRLPSIFSYNPIRHTVDRFLVDEHGFVRQFKTNRVDPYLEPSVQDGIHPNRKKGVVEYSDLTRLTNPRYNPNYKASLSENPRRFCRITGSFTRLYDVAIRNREKNPFRVGR
jgi:hypothetical protein